jgi:hypothetical protein
MFAHIFARARIAVVAKTFGLGMYATVARYADINGAGVVIVTVGINCTDTLTLLAHIHQ